MIGTLSAQAGRSDGVALPAFRHNIIWRADFCKLFAQAVDVDGERIVVDKFVRLPKLVHDYIAADNCISVADEHVQDARFVLLSSVSRSPQRAALRERLSDTPFQESSADSSGLR